MMAAAETRWIVINNSMYMYKLCLVDYIISLHLAAYIVLELLS
jgi:hypothetical protein